tara:strand:+ start:2433 stop:5639 length:3207 start_codon:yes stop_codon:yes gene_type:complete
MAEQTFKSPGFFEQEIDLAARVQSPTGTPAGIVGSSQFGPAFVPVTIGTFRDFENRFGTLDPDLFGPYAVREFLKSRDAVTFMRVLGAGANTSESDILNTVDFGYVKNAGFKIGMESNLSTTSALAANDGTIVNGGGGLTNPQCGGNVQFITAIHTIPANADAGFPIFTDNDSFPAIRETDNTPDADTDVPIVRAMLFTTTGSVFFVDDGDKEFSSVSALPADGLAKITTDEDSTFKLVLATNEAKFGGKAAAAQLTRSRIYSASLNPDNVNYIGKVLNTDPKMFQREKHLLYLDLPVEDSLATIVADSAGKIAIMSGSTNTSSVLPSSWTGINTAPSRMFRDLYGRFDTRYQAPKTTKFISQPFGKLEFNLFHFEALSDGDYANSKWKVSIDNLRASTDPNYKYGTFEVQIRDFEDTDQNPEILERYTNVTLDPKSERFIGRMIGDKKVKYNFDAADEDERRLVISGKYPNKSLRVRIVIDDAIYRREVPYEALPFGFKGVPVLKTNPLGIYTQGGATTSPRLVGVGAGIQKSDANTGHNGAMLPPIPMRFKCTKSALSSTPDYVGAKGSKERIDARLYWGVQFEKIGSNPLNANVTQKPNPLIKAYTKFHGIDKLDVLHDEGEADTFNNNKFSLAKVALYNPLDGNGHISAVTGSAAEHMLDASYLRNGVVDAKTYTVKDPISEVERISLATLVNSSSVVFNRFTSFAKFNNIFYGGFDGLNILDPDISVLNDQSSSTESTYGGKAGDDFTGGLALSGSDDGKLSGSGKKNNVIASYRKAIEIMTDSMTVKTNLLAVPNIRDSYVTDYASNRTRDYSMAMYLMDVASYDESGNRLFINSSGTPDVDQTAEALEGRVFDNNYTATYFPDVFITDPVNNRRVLVPPSIAALGALGYNDSVSYPWFAPAGFNRGGLTFVENVKVRLSSGDRDTLYESRINPIATFPDGGFVIFGQKTLQMAKSALDRVNVRRLLLEVKRQIIEIANLILFEQNTPETRQRFVNLAAPRLALIQAQAGIESFRVIMDDTNNTEQDREENRLNGKIVVVPTRAIEFISIDFIITNAGVAFE